MPTISGTVYDDAGAPAAGRIVRVYRRDTGVLLGDAVTSDGVTPIPGDPHYANVSLLLHFDGANGSTTFTDSSAAPKTITAAPSTVISTASPKFGAGAVSIGGPSGYFHAQGQEFGTADFTVEFLAYVGSTHNTLVDNRVGTPSADLVIYDTDGQNTLGLYAAGAPRLIGPKVSLHSWAHFAICRALGVTRFFVNGVQQGGTYPDANNYNHTTLRFGNNFLDGASMNGYMDEVRVTPGVARYTANFTPPTAPHYDRLPADAAPAGSYGITTAYTGEVQRIVLDDDAGTLYNDLIDRVVLT